MIRTRVEKERWESETLAPYAQKSGDTAGRAHNEPGHPHRTVYERDRARIIHSRAFRRLEYKTQVFLNGTGDHLRTRLTHTIEVASISRTIARALGLNEDLAEAIALAHDLGHAPFGHSGETVLDELMRGHGGFEHNVQSLRIVEIIERKYPRFSGLNLSWEVREGLQKHQKFYDVPTPGSQEKYTSPSLEAQIANLADEVAYNNHDIDDGLRSGLITLEQLQGVSIFQRHHAEVLARYPDLASRRAVAETIRRMINTLIGDLTRTSLARIREVAPACADDVRRAPPLAGFSDDIRREADELKKFLFDNLYRHYRVLRMTTKARRIVRELFAAFLDDPRLLPPDYRRAAFNDQARAIADYIAGMTDRYAIREHRRLFSLDEL